jgi:predicted MFS family arabinose efflux permease
LPYAKVVASAFKERRGLALGITMTGVGLGVMLLPLLSQYSIADYGWRTAYRMLGVLLLTVAFPAVFFLVDERDIGTTSAEEVPGLGLKGALRTGIFWQLAIAVFFVALASSVIFTHIVPMMTDQRTSAKLAARAISIGGLALIIGRLTSGILLDRLPAKFVACGFFTLPLIGILVIINSQGVDLPLLGTFLVGLGLGAEVDMMAYLISFYLGRRAFGEIYGYLFLAFMAGSSLGPLVMGISFSHMGSYRFAMQALILGLIIAVAVTSQIKAASSGATRLRASR